MSVYRGLREVLTCERMLTLSCFWQCLQVCINGGLISWYIKVDHSLEDIARVTLSSAVTCHADDHISFLVELISSPFVIRFEVAY